MSKFARLYPRHRIDISAMDLAFAFASVFAARDRARMVEEAERSFSDAGDVLATLSVRSAFDLLLTALALPAGSEILFSAITIPDMSAIAEAHGLVPVPLDIRPDTLAPSTEELVAAITPRTRMLVVAHLFGARVDLERIIPLCHERGILVAEDCAQAYRGPENPLRLGTDVALFSFGPIKAGTALGGAIARVADPALRQRMRQLQSTHPVQSRRAFAFRIAKYALLHALTRPRIFGLLIAILAALRIDHERLLRGAVRGFPVPAGRTDLLLQRLRAQPCAPLLALLARRLRKFDAARLAKHVARATALTERLPQNLQKPGSNAGTNTHWVFPVMTSAPEDLVGALRHAGFDASTAATNVMAVQPKDASVPPPISAAGILRSLVFFPLRPEMPDGAVDAMVQAIDAHNVRGGPGTPTVEI
jgi:perosamine synthetase